MSHTVPQLLALRDVALEISEAVAEKGHKVDVAMQVDVDFQSAGARALLLRDIVVGASSISASRLGVLDFRPVNGSGREFQCFYGGIDRRYRLRRATRVGGEWRIRANSDSALRPVDDGQGLLIPEEQWVLGWSTSGDDRIDAVFVAPVVGVMEGPPRRLLLGTSIELLGEPVRPLSSEGFNPREETLPGFEESDDDTGYSAGS